MDKVVGWIHDGWIYSRNPEISGRFRIFEGWIWDEHSRGAAKPRYWMHLGHIYGPVGSDNTVTGYVIKDDWLYGPEMKLPFAD